MLNKKSFLLLVSIISIFALLVTACGGAATDESDTAGEQNEQNEADTGNEASGDSQVIHVSLPLGPDSHQAAAVHKFGEELERLTDGRLTIQSHYNNELGGEREVLEGMGINVIDAGIISTAPMGGFVEEFLLFDLPFLFDDREHAYRVLDGEVGQELAEKLEEAANVVVLGWAEDGFNQYSSSVAPIEKPEDLEGIKLRVKENPLNVDTWNALGANATPIAWPEVYTSLQQGVVDGQENPLPTIYDAKFYEVQDYVSITNHTFTPAPLMMSKQLFDSFSEEDQEAILEAGKLSQPAGREASEQLDEETKGLLEDEGVEINEPDVEPFREALKSVYDEWVPQIGEDLVEKVEQAK